MTPVLRRPARIPAFAFVALGVAVALRLGGCAAPYQAPICAIYPDRVAVADSTIRVALGDDVTPKHLHSPRTDAERVVFRHFYEGLVELDCEGTPRPALARSWSPSSDFSEWTFELDGDRRFADGGAVIAQDVKDAWARTRRVARERTSRAALWENVRLKNITANDRRLTIRLDSPDPDFAAHLAHPEFLVTREGAPWPLGTRGLRVRDETRGGVRFVSGAPVTSGERVAHPGVEFRIQPGTNPRDTFTDEVHVLLSRDRAAVEHIASQPGLRVPEPLPWSRLYLYFDPAGPGLGDDPIHQVRVDLSRDVLGSLASPADSYWLDPAEPPEPARGDPSLSAVQTPAPFGGAVWCAPGDPDARAIAERLASLRSRDGSRVPVEIAPTRRRFDEQLSGPGVAGRGFVVRVDREIAGAGAQEDHLAARLPGGRLRVTPLVKTRSVLLVRARLTGVVVGYDGVPRFDTAGWAKERSL